MAQLSEMNLTKTLAGAAVLLALVAIVTAPRNVTPTAFLDQGEPFFPDFEDPNAATTLEVIEFDEETATAKPFKVTNDNGRWTIPSHHDYPADGEDRLANTAAGIIAIRKDDFRSDNVADHEALGVLDPLEEGTASLSGRGTRVTVRGENDKLLADLILGNELEDREGFRFVRVPDQKRVYAAQIDADISTTFADWIDSDLLQVDQSAIDTVVLQDYSIDELTGRLVERDVATFEKEDGTWTADALPANQEVDTTKMNDLLREVAGLSIVGVRPKPEGLSNRLDDLTVGRSDLLSLQDKGYYLTQTGDLKSNEGEVQIETDEGILYTLRFGEVLYGSGDAVSAGSESTADESSGPGENRYLFISAQLAEALPEAPEEASNREFADKPEEEWTDEDRRNSELADALEDWEASTGETQATVEALQDRFAPWYYVISADSFEKIRLRRSDLVREKETE